MTDKEKLEKIKQLADTMYNKMQNLTTDTSGIRKAMDDYRQFIIYQYYKEEPVSEDLEEAIDTYLKSYWGGEKEKQEWPFLKKMVIYFAKWQKEQMMAKAIDARCFGFQDAAALFTFRLPAGSYLVGSKVKVIVINED